MSISDKFVGFAENAAVLTYSQLVAALQDTSFGSSRLVGLYSVKASSGTLLPGLLAQIGAVTPRSIIEGCAATVAPASQSLVHKKLDFNVLVSAPIQIGADEFSFALLIDERCAEISDHVTGQHVPGMLVLEAARQAMTVSLEARGASRETPRG